MMVLLNLRPGDLKQRGGLALAVALLLTAVACAPTPGPPPDDSGEVVFGYDAAGQPKTLMLKPVDGGVLTSRFGLRKNPMGGGGTKRHLGTDYGAKSGSPVRAAGDGVVASAGLRGSYGNYVLIRHDHTYASGYAHMSAYADGLWSGQKVRKGQVIGYVGTTGRSTGPHLHYEVYRDGERIDPFGLDPWLGGTVARKSFEIDGTANETESAGQTDDGDGFNFLDTASQTWTAATESIAAAADRFSRSETGEKIVELGHQAKVAIEEQVLTPLDLEKLFDGFGEEDPDVITQ